MQNGKTKKILSDIKNKIKTGQWQCGYTIPSQRALSEIYEVNRSTIIEVIDQLKSDGLVASHGRHGTVVVGHGWTLSLSEQPKHWGESVDSGFHKANHPIIQKINQLEFDDSYVRLGTGELSPSLYPKDEMSAIFAKVSNNLTHLGYECAKGSIDLRKAVSHYLESIGISASVESILIVSGSLQALQLISIGLMSQNAKLITESPSYVKSLNIFQSVGISLEGVPMDQDGLSLTKLTKAMTDQRDQDYVLYTIPTFHNPTGITMTEARRKDLLELSSTFRLPIIEDDAYRELWLDQPPPKPLKSADAFGNVLYLGTVSKSLAPGLRIGWVVGPESVITRLGDIKMQLDYGASSISQAIVTECLNSGMYARYINTLRDRLRARRTLALSLLEAHFSEIATWDVPTGGFYVWLKLNTPIASKQLFKKAIDEWLLINPGDIYDYDKNNHLRLSYAYASEAQLSEALPKLATIIRTLTLVG